jgi:hypothetical protein
VLPSSARSGKIGYEAGGWIEQPMAVMEAEHESAGAALATLWELTQGYAPPEDGCPTFRGLYYGLAELERGTIVGQANGQGGREHGQKCDQLPGWRDISNPEHRQYIAKVWGIDERELPGPGVDAYEMFRKIDAGEIKGLLSICFNPKVSLPDNAFVTRALEKLEFFVAIDFFLNDTAWHADVVLPGSLHEEDEGTVTQVEGRIIKINKAVECPGEAREDWRIIQDIACALGRPKGFTFTQPREIFEELRVASKGGVADYSGVTYEKIERQMGVFWPCYSEDPQTGAPTANHPGTPRLFERGSYNPVANGNGPFYFPDGRARFNVAEYRPPVDDASDEYPIFLTTGRVVSQFLSGTQTRRIGPLVRQYPEPRIELHPRWRPSWESVMATGPWRKPREGPSRCVRRSSRPYGRTRSSSRITGQARRARTSSPSRHKIRSARFRSTRSAVFACGRQMVRRPTQRYSNRRHRLREMIHDEAIEKPFVTVLQRGQVDVLLDVRWLAAKALEDLLKLLLLGQDLWREEPAQIETVSFLFGEGRAFVEGRVVKKRHAAQGALTTSGVLVRWIVTIVAVHGEMSRNLHGRGGSPHRRHREGQRTCQLGQVDFPPPSGGFLVPGFPRRQPLHEPEQLPGVLWPLVGVLLQTREHEFLELARNPKLGTLRRRHGNAVHVLDQYLHR